MCFDRKTIDSRVEVILLKGRGTWTNTEKSPEGNFPNPPRAIAIDEEEYTSDYIDKNVPLTLFSPYIIREQLCLTGVFLSLYREGPRAREERRDW